MSTEQYASAFHYLSTAINLQPSFARAYTYLAVTLSRLDDFENSCAAYEKSIGITDDYITHLNYAVTLYTNDEIEKSKVRFDKFEQSLQLYINNQGLQDTSSDIDPEILRQAEALRNVLQKANVEF